MAFTADGAPRHADERWFLDSGAAMRAFHEKDAFRPDGTLAEVYPLHPFDETPVASRGEDLQYAVELNQGWFREHGVRPGARLDLDAVRTALRARGFDPRRHGL